jgi:hypothetical protein
MKRKAPTVLLDIALEGLRLNSETLKAIDENIETASRRHIDGELDVGQIHAALSYYAQHHKIAERKRSYYLQLINMALQNEPIDRSAPELIRLLNKGENLLNREEQLLGQHELDPDWREAGKDFAEQPFAPELTDDFENDFPAPPTSSPAGQGSGSKRKAVPRPRKELIPG